MAQQRGLVWGTAGGTRHAFASYSSGFCLLNDPAVVTKHLLTEARTMRKILIVDLDQGQVCW